MSTSSTCSLIIAGNSLVEERQSFAEVSPLRRDAIISSAALLLAAGFLALFMSGGTRFAIGLTLKPIVEELGWARTELGLAVAMFQIVSAATMLISGYLADRAGPRSVLAGGLFVSAIGIGLMAVMTAPWHAIILYGLIYAIGNGAASTIPVGVMVSRSFPDRIGLSNAIVTSGMSVGQFVIMSVLAAVLISIGWRSVYLWLGVVNLALVPLLLVAIPKSTPTQASIGRPLEGIGVREAALSRRFWLLVAIYAICGFNDFFVTTHVVAFAQDRGIGVFLSGNLLAAMGVTALVGVILAGTLSDRSGPIMPTALAFAIRVAAFALIMIDQSPVSVTVFALAFGLTLLVTAPLTVAFVSEWFGMRHLGALTGVITMVHHMFGGLGAYLGAFAFDATGTYDIAFATMFATSAVALLLTLLLRFPPKAESLGSG